MKKEYSEFSEKTRILQKTASIYGWTYRDTFKDCPKVILYELLELQKLLDEDQNVISSGAERAEFKNLLRLHKPKED